MAESKREEKGLSWVEKYRPSSFAEMVGHNKTARTMLDWARKWKDDRHPDRRGLILEGDPGVGKTTAAMVLASEMEWDYLELNASDSRNLENIRKVATRGAQSRSITDVGSYERNDSPKMRLIILDEADNLYERASGGDSELGDRGGKRAIVELVSETKQPVVLIVNDYYALTKGSGRPLISMCQRIKFRKLMPASVAKRLRQILEMESISHDGRVLQEIAKESGGDMRSAVGDLQIVSSGKRRITAEDLKVLGSRDTKENIFKILGRLFRSGTIQEHRRALMESDEAPDKMILWVDENVTSYVSHPEDLDTAYRLISRSDVYLGRVRRRQNYRLWSYASDMMASVYLSKKHPNKRRSPYSFPSYLKSMSRTKDSRKMLKESSSLIGDYTHTSGRDVRNDALYRYGELAARDHQFAAFLMAVVGLNKDHLKLITGGKLKPAHYRKIRKLSEEIREETATPHLIETGGLMDFHHEEEEEDDDEEDGNKEDEPDEKDNKQMSLFEF